MTAFDLTLGLLAGGAASRLGGLDKAWLIRDGVPQVRRLAQRYDGDIGHVLISANRNLPRYADIGLTAIADARPGLGPLSGIDALASACATPWLLTLPADALELPDDLPSRLRAASERGAYAIDDDGIQPLFACWPVALLRPALRDAWVADRLAVRDLQAAIGMAGVRFDGLRFGNLNTPADLARAGLSPPTE